GVLYIADQGRQQILKRLPNGRFEVAAGTGVAGDSGDGGPATHAAIADPASMAVARSGALYFVQPDARQLGGHAGSSVVREVATDGRISTVIGADPDCRAAGVTARRMPAQDADLPGGVSLAVTPAGNLALTGFTCPNGVDGGPLLDLGSAGELIEAPRTHWSPDTSTAPARWRTQVAVLCT
ncbi:MAG: hypothetical protein ACP5H2_11740, partial [Solirubrobacteraceae bacterium]